jgi:signal transduction histidine kinase
LKDHLKAIRMIFHKILEYRLGSDVVEVVNLLFTKILDENSKTRPGMIERNLKELHLADWLRNRNIVGAEAIADDLNALGLDIDDAQKFLRCIPDHWASAGMEWLHNTLVMERMVSDIEDSSRRIAELIGSVKKFTHMDQGQGMRYADIHEGIRNTIIMLQHRIKKDNVRVVENFDRELPPVKAMIGELNQVWTNLIDNALDAMEESSDGVLELHTKSDGKSIFVTVADNGTGIPEEIASSVFDPFFTTKPVGKGTGLGLDVVMRIVRQHSGTVKLKSRPGRTEFIVCFPINGR